MKLTDAGIRALQPRAETYAVYDEQLKGFGVRVSPAGTKSFTFVFRLNGHKTRLHLGKFPFVSLADARAEAHRAAGVVKGDRKDPRVVREDSEVRNSGGLTITAMTDLYLDSDKFKSGREATRHQFQTVIEDEIRPALGPRPLVTIVPGDLVDWSQGIIDRGAPITANQSFKILRLWNWARRRLVRRGVPPFPLAGYGKPWEGERPRKRHLSPDLIKSFVEAVDEEPRMTAVWWWLMLLNLTRKTETSLLEKHDVIWESERGPYLIIPAEKSKNHQPLFQPLTDYSELLLRLALKHAGDSRWVMPGKKGGPRFQRTGVPGSRVSRRICAKVSPHDLRHTVATILGEIGVEPHLIDALQNHRLPQSTQVTGTYNDALVWAYFNQKREALQQWHQHLDQKILKGTLSDHIRQAVDGPKQFEEAMKLNMKLGPRSDAHRLAAGRRAAVPPRQRRSA